MSSTFGPGHQHLCFGSSVSAHSQAAPHGHSQSVHGRVLFASDCFQHELVSQERMWGMFETVWRSVFNKRFYFVWLFNFSHCWEPFPAVYPSNIQFQTLFPEILAHGYRAAIGTVEARFMQRDGTRVVVAGSVGISDGQCKILTMAAIVAFLEELEVSVDAVEKDTEMCKVLESFAAVRCSYTEFTNPSHHFLHSLRIFAPFYDWLFSLLMVLIFHEYQSRINKPWLINCGASPKQ